MGFRDKGASQAVTEPANTQKAKGTRALPTPIQILAAINSLLGTAPDHRDGDSSQDQKIETTKPEPNPENPGQSTQAQK